MSEFLAYLREQDWSSHARNAWDMVESFDPCFGGLVVVLLVLVGHKIASGSPRLYNLGLRLGALTFLIHGAWALIRHGGWESTPFAQVSRSGLVAGCVLSFTWIVLPVAFFLYRYFRVALAAFLLYAGYALLTAPSFDQEILPGIALRGAIVAGLAMIVAWILQPLWDWLAPWWRKPTPVPSPKSEPKREPETEAEPRQLRRERRQWHRLVILLTRPANIWPQPEPETPPLLPSPELRRRRDQARLSAELTYVRAMPDIAQQLPRDLFEIWMKRYLGDHLPPDEVEENSRQLQLILTRSQSTLPSSGSFLNLEDLHHWFVGEQKRIQALDLDPAEKQARLLQLQEMFVSLSDRILQDPGQAVFPMRSRKELGLLLDPERQADVADRMKAE